MGNFKHGATLNKRTQIPREYRAWASMIARCYCPSCRNYAQYGGKGIKVCNQWRHDYSAFLADMGKKPSFKHSLDRINNQGNYTPKNCRWATAQMQADNRKNTIKIKYRGEVRSLKGWARYLGVNYYSLRDRFLAGWDIEKMFTKPLKGKFYERHIQEFEEGE